MVFRGHGAVGSTRCSWGLGVGLAVLGGLESKNVLSQTLNRYLPAIKLLIQDSGKQTLD